MGLKKFDLHYKSWGALIIFVILITFCLFLSKNIISSSEGQLVGTLGQNVPIKVEINQPFEFDVWLSPVNPSFSGKVEVFMDNNPKVKYEPRKFTLKVGDRQKVRATILKTSTGLAVIAASADHWEGFDLTVDAGFSAKLKSNINEPIESGTTKGLILSFVSEDGTPAPLDVDTILYLHSSKIKLLEEVNNKWVDEVKFKLPLGTRSLSLKIMPNSWFADTDVIAADLYSYRELPVYNFDNVTISILPPWYAPLLMAILGGILYSITQLLKDITGYQGSIFRFILAKVLPGLIPGLVAGALAYLLASWGVLGIRVDTTSLKGFVILGFLFSYVGVDIVLKAVTQRKT